jgi:hypothetical protein
MNQPDVPRADWLTRNLTVEQANMAIHRRSFLLVSVAGFCAAFASLAFGATASNSCATDPSSRQLDFWVGDWAVGGAGASASAISHVSLTLDKCAVIENWDGGRGHRGENMFAYSADDKSWHGMFADNEGRVHVFVDGKASSDSVMFTGPSTGPDGKLVVNRVSIVRISPDRVDQVWEKSEDNGVTWSTAFRGQYARKKP